MKKEILFIALSCSMIIGANVHVVSTSADSGPGSLRQAILDANADMSPPRSIVFDITNGRDLVIAIELESYLPALEVELTFDQEPLWYQFGIEKAGLLLCYAANN